MEPVEDQRDWTSGFLAALLYVPRCWPPEKPTMQVVGFQGWERTTRDTSTRGAQVLSCGILIINALQHPKTPAASLAGVCVLCGSHCGKARRFGAGQPTEPFPVTRTPSTHLTQMALMSHKV
jgi:hypothetical protein